jgi:6-phosphogluconolactonase
MVNESLLTKIAIPAGNVFRVPAENPDAAAAASDYEAQLRQFFELPPEIPPEIRPAARTEVPPEVRNEDRPGQFPRFDLILLGMGPDGHTASLFPDSPALDEQSRLVVANWVAKFNTHRITFTFPVLNRAAEVMFMASGADKADMLRHVLEGKFEGKSEGKFQGKVEGKPEGTPTPPLPAQRVQPSDGRLLWMLDEAAAAKLSR